MRQDPLVSVVMGSFEPCWSRLRRAVDSLMGQTLPEWELLLWDDGSSPQGALALEQAARLDPRVRLVHAGENRGLAHGLNQCVERARGPYIARLDDDDLCFPQRLRRQVDFLWEHPAYQWVGSAALLLDESGPWGRLRPPTRPGRRDFLRTSPYIHPSVMFRREVLELAGGYREDKALFGCEDYELFARLHSRGFRGYNLPECLLGYWESRASYAKRTPARRLREAALRCRALPRLGLPLPEALWGAARPLAVSLVPPGVQYRLKRWERGLPHG